MAGGRRVRVRLLLEVLEVSTHALCLCLCPENSQLELSHLAPQSAQPQASERV